MDKFNILQAIGYCRSTIASNAGPDVKAVAYCWLIHLVGDIHQPLHCNELVSVDRFPEGDAIAHHFRTVAGYRTEKGTIRGGWRPSHFAPRTSQNWARVPGTYVPGYTTWPLRGR